MNKINKPNENEDKMMQFIKSKIPESFDDKGNIKKTQNDLLIEFFKTSKDAGYEIRTPEDFNKFMDKIHNMNLSAVERNAFNQIVEQAQKDYRGLLELSVQRKNSADNAIIEDLQNKQRERGQLIDQFFEKNLTVAYLDKLAKTEGLHDYYIEQLHTIMGIMSDNPNCTIAKDRLTVSEDGLLLVDGFIMPKKKISGIPSIGVRETGRMGDVLDIMEISNIEGSMAFLNFTAELMGLSFDRGELTSSNLADGSLSSSKIMKQLYSNSNKRIAYYRKSIFGDQVEILLGVDDDGYGIVIDTFDSRPDDHVEIFHNNSRNTSCRYMVPLRYGDKKRLNSK